MTDEKIDSITGVNEYSEIATYLTGDYCIYNGVLYKAKTETTGTWVAANWEEVSIMDQMVIRNKVEVHFLYRGQNKGDCILIKTPEKNILIDLGGTNANTLISKLLEKNVTKIDYLIISHFHGDHTLGSVSNEFVRLINSEDIDFSNCIYFFPHTPTYSEFVYSDTDVIDESTNRSVQGANYIPNLEAGIIAAIDDNSRIINPNNEQIVNIDNISLKFLNCDTSKYVEYYDYVFFSPQYGNKYVTKYNNFSMVVEMTHNNNKFLFTGDIEKEAQANIAPYLSYCDVLKVEHHGVNSELNKDYFRKAVPETAVIMNTGDAIINRPSVPAYKMSGSRIFSTNKSHDIIAISNEKSISIISDEGIDDYEYDSGLGLQFNNIRDIYTLRSPQNENIIPADGNLNDFVDPGLYNGSSSSTILNRPFLGAGFKLKVEHILNIFRVRQTVYNNINSDTYVRFILLDNERDGVVVPKYLPWEKITTYSISNIIDDGFNLNNILTPGEYISTTASKSQTLQNCPHKTSAFKLKVEWLHDTSRYRQTIYASNDASDTYVRSYSAGGWQSWRKFTTTLAT